MSQSLATRDQIALAFTSCRLDHYNSLFYDITEGLMRSTGEVHLTLRQCDPVYIMLM